MPDLAKRDKTVVVMYYVYFLKSTVNNDLYIGSTKDIVIRLNSHNTGRVKSTKAYRPWKLLGYEQYNSRSESVIQERLYKNHQQKELLKIKYGLVAK